MSLQMDKLEEDKLSEIVSELSGLHSLATQIAEAGDDYDRFTLRQLDDHIINLHQISLDINHNGLQAVCGRLRENIHYHSLAGSFISNSELALISEWKSLVKVYVNNSNNNQVVEALLNNMSKPSWPVPLATEARQEISDILHNPFAGIKEEAESDNVHEIVEQNALSELSTSNEVDESREVQEVLLVPDNADTSDESQSEIINKDNNSSAPAEDGVDLVDDLEEFEADMGSAFNISEQDSEEIGIDLSVTIETSYKDVSALMSDDDLIDQLYEDNEAIEEQSMASYFEQEEPDDDEINIKTEFSDDAENVMSQLFAPASEESEAQEEDNITNANEPQDDNTSLDQDLAKSDVVEEDKVENSSTEEKNEITGLSDKSNDLLRELFTSKPTNDISDANKLIEEELFAPADESENLDDNSDEYEKEFDEDLSQAEQETQHELAQVRLIGLNDGADLDQPKEQAAEDSSDKLVEDELFAPADESSVNQLSSDEYQQAFEQDLAEASAEDAQDQVDSTSSTDVKPTDDQALDDDEVAVDAEPDSDRVDESKESHISANDADVQIGEDKETPSPAYDIHELEEELIDDNAVKRNDSDTATSIENISINDSGWSEEQKELLSLIISEVQDTIAQQHEVLAVFDEQPIKEDAVRDVVAMYAEQIERMGSAADMVGLTALQKICELLQIHFTQVNNAGIDQIVLSKDKVKQWPQVVYRYLADIYSFDGQHGVLEYVADSEWPSPISENAKDELLSAFSNSTIRVESAGEDGRKKVASETDIDISISEEVQPELLDGMLQELPHQTEEFSVAMQKLVEDDYLQQLEITQRIAHTIKGAANTVGITGVATLTHNLEDILQALLKAQAKPNAQLHGALIEAADCLEQMTESLLGAGDAPKDAVTTLQTILDWGNYIDEFGPPQEEQLSPNQDKASAAVSVKKSTTQERSAAVKQVSKLLKKDKSTTDAALRVSADLRVPANAIDELLKQSGESIITAAQMQEQVDHLLAQLRDMKINKDSVLSLSQQLEHLIDIQGVGAKHINKEQDNKFDPLEMDQYNELHTFSRRLMEATADSVELVKQFENRILQLESSVASQLRTQKEYQHAVLTTRMVPAESVIPRLKRGVRQSAKISNKSVELFVYGGDTLIDSKILGNLIDPLMHLLRNSVDHGIESADERIAIGKEEKGRIELSFLQEGDRVVVSCLDDGRGLDVDQIRTHAIETQLITEDQELSDDEIYQLIMRHGFTTRSEVTQLSGRGVGMDVVYSRIKELNGSITVNSQRNMGTTIELAFPVSLLSVHALLVNVNTHTVAVSTHGIEEIIQAKANDLYEDAGELRIKHEEESYPVVHIEELLGVSAQKDDINRDYTALLVHEFGDQRKVILVDKVLSTNDIVIKPFSRYLPKILGIIGATVLGNGDIATVVDVIDLLSQDEEKYQEGDNKIIAEEEKLTRVTALIVEDSISTRKSLAEFMQDLNYEVYTAKDGVEAIEMMRKHRPNILLTDLEMPRMNGLELTSHIRSNDDTKDIPIIMITSRTTEKHKQEAIAIGVNEYLPKPYQEDLLLEKVRRLAPLG